MVTMEKRLAVVTGANTGIGLEVTRQLARRGLRVVLTSLEANKGTQAQKGLAQEGLEVFYHALDVTKRSSVAAFARHLAKEHGRVDVLVNNAGILIDRSASSVLDEEENVFHTTLETNFYGALRVCQAVVPLMRRHHYSLVNMPR
jgi:NAD(P)-dependent dehydrogenase (short-subunit alcohol dehydrogenase family)